MSARPLAKAHVRLDPHQTSRRAYRDRPTHVTQMRRAGSLASRTERDSGERRFIARAHAVNCSAVCRPAARVHGPGVLWGMANTCTTDRKRRRRLQRTPTDPRCSMPRNQRIRINASWPGVVGGRVCQYTTSETCTSTRGHVEVELAGACWALHFRLGPIFQTCLCRLPDSSSRPGPPP